MERKRFSFKLMIGYIKYLSLALLFGILPLVMYWANNLGQVRLSVIEEPFFVIVICVWLLFTGFLLIFRSLQKTTLFLVFFLFLFFSYGHIDQLLPEENVFGGFHLFILYVFIFLLGSVFIVRTKKFAATGCTYLQVVGLLLLFFNVVKILRYDPRIWRGNEAPPVTIHSELPAQDLPDVYYIVLDSYARKDVLKNEYQFDNSEFLQALSERGFYLPECAFSNYDATHLTIPSVLNMDYLDQMGISTESLGETSSKNIDLSINNQVRRVFSEMGYQFVTTRGWAPFDDITNSDRYLNYYDSLGSDDKLAEKYFAYKFWNTTLIRAYSVISRIDQKESPVEDTASETESSINMSLEYEMSYFWYHQTKYVMESLKELPNDPDGPFLVYAHINAPHHPYVFNRDGSFRFVMDLANEDEYYIDAITYMNGQVLQMIDAIIANSDTPPIIMLQADHGMRYYGAGINTQKILSAYYLPGEIDIEPYDTITPVNNFRLVLHDYFDSSITLLPDKLFVNSSGHYEEEKATCGY